MSNAKQQCAPYYPPVSSSYPGRAIPFLILACISPLAQPQPMSIPQYYPNHQSASLQQFVSPPAAAYPQQPYQSAPVTIQPSYTPPQPKVVDPPANPQPASDHKTKSCSCCKLCCCCCKLCCKCMKLDCWQDECWGEVCTAD